MIHQFSRTELLIGKESMQILANSRVAVFGIGGVGGYAVEALVRSGIGAIDIIDNDKVCVTNINRQIYAAHSTIGQYKVDVAQKRILDINPEVKVSAFKTFYMPETSSMFDFSKYDYIVDAIDTVTGKIELVLKSEEAGTPIISSMGAGNKVNPTDFEVADIYKTSVCPLAKVMRRELKKRGVKKLKVVYSKEIPLSPYEDTYENLNSNCVNLSDKDSNRNTNCVNLSNSDSNYNTNCVNLSNSDSNYNTNCVNTDTERKPAYRRQIPGSTAFVPSVAGLIIASEVVRDLIKYKK